MTEMTETKKVEVPEGFMTGKFPLKKRAYGEEQPGIKVGPFKIRLPLIHLDRDGRRHVPGRCLSGRWCYHHHDHLWSG